jgi:heat shock protein HslJ
VVLAACNQNAPGASPTPRVSPLANTDWTLSTMAGRQLPSGSNVTLLFGLVNASGFSGCNQYNVGYATLDTGLLFGAVTRTNKTCGTTIDDLEASYYESLSSVTHWAIAGDTLTMTKATAETILTYTRMAPDSVEGPWTITHYNNGSGAVTSMPSGVSATVTFNGDGTVTGFGGCNNFNGGYSTGALGTIAIGPLMSTMKACGDPADTTERQILTALQTATKWDVTSGALELRDSGGALQIDATSATQ